LALLSPPSTHTPPPGGGGQCDPALSWC